VFSEPSPGKDGAQQAAWEVGIFNMGAWHCATMAMIRLRVTQHSRPHKEHTQAEAAVEKAKIEDAFLSGLINWDKKRGLNRLGTALWIRPALF
jgi:hypothetical protein